MNRCVVGIDLGGTKILGGLVDQAGRILARSRRLTPVAEGPEGIFSSMKAMIRELLAQAGEQQVVGIGLGIPGPVDYQTGISLHSPNLGWRNQPVLPAFAEFGLPVAMENDVRCHALAELHFGAGQGLQNFILVAIGTGIGSGIILNGSLYRGSALVAGEIGHITLEPNGPLCGCGKRGCLETLASGKGIGRRAREAGVGETSRDLFSRAAEGDWIAESLVDDICRDLGRGISHYINLMNPQRVIIGGGVAQAGDLLFGPLRRYVEQETMPIIRGTCDVVPAHFGEEAGIVGAATLIPALTEG